MGTVCSKTNRLKRRKSPYIYIPPGYEEVIRNEALGLSPPLNQNNNNIYNNNNESMTLSQPSHPALFIPNSSNTMNNNNNNNMSIHNNNNNNNNNYPPDALTETTASDSDSDESLDSNNNNNVNSESTQQNNKDITPHPNDTNSGSATNESENVFLEEFRRLFSDSESANTLVNHSERTATTNTMNNHSKNSAPDTKNSSTSLQSQCVDIARQCLFHSGRQEPPASHSVNESEKEFLKEFHLLISNNENMNTNLINETTNDPHESDPQDITLPEEETPQAPISGISSSSSEGEALLLPYAPHSQGTVDCRTYTSNTTHGSPPYCFNQSPVVLNDCTVQSTERTYLYGESDRPQFYPIRLGSHPAGVIQLEEPATPSLDTEDFGRPTSERLLDTQPPPDGKEGDDLTSNCTPNRVNPHQG
ncbi:hypothetical protein ADEAN_000317400 [Angomonas deanei]|uniref:Uncharacterized protein n=1 Tax=Angomonas deanei TaxID=59799 RepID=A0A7G2C804_9TRYP|nr:hypothetical protein ADEAN_000317400 [Angomonas deanei]